MDENPNTEVHIKTTLDREPWIKTRPLRHIAWQKFRNTALISRDTCCFWHFPCSRDLLDRLKSLPSLPGPPDRKRCSSLKHLKTKFCDLVDRLGFSNISDQKGLFPSSPRTVGSAWSQGLPSYSKRFQTENQNKKCQNIGFFFTPLQPDSRQTNKLQLALLINSKLSNS